MNSDDTSMSWRIRFHPAIRKDLRRLPREIRNFIISTALPEVAAHPYAGESLHGPIREFFKYRVGDYRIAYAIDEKHHEVVAIEIGPRGGFYERLRRRIKR